MAKKYYVNDGYSPYGDARPRREVEIVEDSEVSQYVRVKYVDSGKEVSTFKRCLHETARD